MNRFLGILLHWLPTAVVATGLCGLVYVAVQQNYRQTLNDPQVQIVRDMALALESGRQPVEVVPRNIFDAGKSLSTFVAVYDSKGNPLEASAVIDGAPPKPPGGVFEFARRTGENRVTWQPNPATRIALVVHPVNSQQGWFVAAGRNMREVESRIARLTQMIAVALITILATTLMLELVRDFIRRRSANS